MGYESWKLVVIILITLVYSASSQNPAVCSENGNYTRNSRYRANLNTLLSSISSNITDNGFFNASVGQNQDRVNALALCRGDLTLDQCRTCVQTASDELPQQCPNQKQAIIWYEICSLRYTNESIYGTLTTDPARGLSNAANVSRPDEFRAARTRLYNALRAQAADGGSARKVGAGAISISGDSQPIYGMMQCTPDLSAEECDNCLQQAALYFQRCCDTAAGLRALTPSCNLRYELLPFYNETRLRELQVVPLSLLPSPPPSSPPLPLSPPPSSPPLPPAPGRNDDGTRSGEKDDNNTTKIVIIVVVPVVACLTFAACALIYLRKRMKQRSYEITDTTEEISTVESIQYDFGKIRAATNDFAEANKLGQGGFGAVYRGKFSNGQDIAVKRLGRDSGQGSAEFKNEVVLLAKLQHRNLVRLLGFAMVGTERVLVYEFVQNASLDQFIFGNPIKRSYLDWDKRFKIIWGIARGLVYLHEDSRLKIIHRDMKASNVLLDGDMLPKIADFGMARLFNQDETQGNTSKIVGTYGYMSPEYLMRGQFSDKSDVFSFGVLVLEIVSGRRNNDIQNGENSEDLLILTWKNWRDGTPENVIDPVILENGRGSMHEMVRCIHMGLLCVQENAANRPTMTNAILMLSSSTMTLAVPLEPAFFVPSRYGPDTITKESNSSNASNVNVGMSEGSPRNDTSVSELDPR